MQRVYPMNRSVKAALSILVVVAAIAGGFIALDHPSACQITVEPTEGGTVSGSGEYKVGETVTLSASPDGKHRFTGWYDGDTLLSTEREYTFTATGSMNVTASFSTIYLNIRTSVTEGGTASGSGEYLIGETVTLTASPDERHQFDGWYSGKTLLSSDAEYVFRASKDLNVTASFSVIQYEVGTATTEGGTVSGEGTYEIGETVSVTAANEYGYVFSGWYEGGSRVSSDATLTFVASGNRDLIALFEPEVFDIGLSENYDGGNQTGAGSYAYKTTATVTATTKSGYVFKGWSVDGGIVSTSSTYRFTITGDQTVTATYGIVHDASFTVTTTSSYAPTTLKVTPKYNVEISDRTVRLVDQIGSANMGSRTSSGGTLSFQVGTYTAYSVTQTITYTDGVTVTSTQEYVVDGKVSHSYSWKYQKDEWYSILTSWFYNNKSSTIELDLSFAWYYEKLSDDIPRGYSAGKARMSDYVTSDDPVIISLASKLKEVTSSMSDLQRLNCVLKFVQSFEYQYDSDGKGVAEYYKYPAEMLWEQKGDCEDHAILFAALVDAMGYDVQLCHVVCYNSNGTIDGYHMAAGVAVSGASGSYFTVDGKKYYYCEATADSGTGYYNWANIVYKNKYYVIDYIVPFRS